MGDQSSVKWKHKAEELRGKAKEVIGGLTGDERLKGEGQSDQAKAKAHQGGDKVKDTAEGAKERIRGWTDPKI